MANSKRSEERVQDNQTTKSSVHASYIAAGTAELGGNRRHALPPPQTQFIYSFPSKVLWGYQVTKILQDYLNCN